MAHGLVVVIPVDHFIALFWGLKQNLNTFRRKQKRYFGVNYDNTLQRLFCARSKKQIKVTVQKLSF